MSRVLVLGAVAALVCSALGCPAPEATRRRSREEMFEFEPAAGGKTQAPVGARVRYPLRHPVGQPVEVEIDLWATDTDAGELTASARPKDDSAEWSGGERSQTFRGPIPRGERRTYRFSVTPKREGIAYVSVDLAADGASRHLTLVLHGGGEVTPEQLGVSGKPRGPVRME